MSNSLDDLSCRQASRTTMETPQMSAQIHRVIRILNALSTGQHLTTTEIQEKLSHQPDIESVSLRQIQRDLNNISSSGVPLSSERDGKELRWHLPREYRMMQPVSVDQSELVALHILKGGLGSWKGTRIEKDIDRLRTKMEQLAPGRVFLDDIVSDVSPGQYQNAVPDDMLECIINAIVDPRWDEVTYHSIHAGTTKTFVVSFCRLVNHSGRLYVIAWTQKHKQYITLAADRIQHVGLAALQPSPLHTFSESEYRRQRFGVYSGDAKAVKLRVSREGADYFASRQWHPSAKVVHHRDGTLTLTMTVPISPELITWVLGWANTLTAQKPSELVQECKRVAKAVVKW